MLWIDNLNSDGQQFNQYQQKKKQPLTKHIERAYITHDIKNPGPALFLFHRATDNK